MVRAEPGRTAQGALQGEAALVERVPQQVWTARPDGTLDYVNRAVVDYFARPAESILDAGWQAVVHPEDLPACLGAWTHSLSTGNPYEIQFRLLRADGEYRWHHGRATAERTEAGQITGWVGVNTDIDEQKRQHEARFRRLLREQHAREASERGRARLRALLDQAPAAICILEGPDHTFSLLNEHYLRILGAHRDLIGRPIREALPELAGQGFFELLDRVYQTGERYVGNEAPAAIARRAVGQVEGAYFNFVYEPTRDQEGRVDGIFVHAVDVTDQVRARERIARLQSVTARLAETTSREQVAATLLDRGLVAFGACAGAVMLVSADGHWLEMLALSGYSHDVAEAFARVPVTADLPIPSVLRSGQPEFLPTLDAVVTRYPHLAQTHRGEGHGAVSSAPLIVNGHALGGLTVSFDGPRSFDVDEQRLLLAVAGQASLALERVRLHEAERAAHIQAESDRDRLQQVIDVLPEGIAIANLTGAIVLSNPAARQIWGQSPPSTGVPEYQAAYGVWRLDGQPYPSEEIPIARSLLSGEVVEGDQMLLRNATTGELVPLLVNSAPLADGSGVRTGAVTVFQDISAIKALDREKDEFLASASHDLKNPLAAIKGTAQILLRRLARSGTLEPERLAAGLTSIDDTVTHMAAQINRLLDVARFRMGQPLDLDRAPTDLVELTRQAVAMAQSATERHRLQLSSTTETLTGDWDADRLGRVLNNLLSNAVKYSVAGGEVYVTLAAEDDAAAQVAVLTVADRGIGIPADDLPFIFQRFRRARNVAGAYEGTGIGLADVDQIVRLHRGSVSVESRQGAGTTVTVRLPRSWQL